MTSSRPLRKSAKPETKTMEKSTGSMQQPTSAMRQQSPVLFIQKYERVVDIDHVDCPGHDHPAGVDIDPGTQAQYPRLSPEADHGLKGISIVVLFDEDRRDQSLPFPDVLSDMEKDTSIGDVSTTQKKIKRVIRLLEKTKTFEKLEEKLREPPEPLFTPPLSEANNE